MKKSINALTDKVLFLCNTIFETSGISIFHFDSDLQMTHSFSRWENHMKNFFFLNCHYDLSAVAQSNDSTPFFYSDSLHLNWFILPLVGHSSFLVLGPTFDTDVTPAFFQKKMEFKTMSVSSQIHFFKMLQDIPVCPYTQFLRYLSMIYYGIYGSMPVVNNIRQEITPDDKTADSFPISDDSVKILKSHGSRLPEKLMLEGVRTGNIHLFHNNQINSSSTIVGVLANDDPLRQAKNAIISQITLVTRAAVEGGMNTDRAYSLSDFYIQQLELCHTQDEVYSISWKMYDTFVEQVHKIQTQNYSPIVLYMCTYIDKHILEVISLEKMAEELGYDTYYMTTIFRKNTGKTIKNYISEKKTEQAKILLTSTRMDIREISDYLSFKSASYFCTQFKKITGESPLSYRKRENSPV